MFNSLPTFLTNSLILNMSNLLVNRSLAYSEDAKVIQIQPKTDRNPET